MKYVILLWQTIYQSKNIHGWGRGRVVRFIDREDLSKFFFYLYSLHSKRFRSLFRIVFVQFFISINNFASAGQFHALNHIDHFSFGCNELVTMKTNCNDLLQVKTIAWIAIQRERKYIKFAWWNFFCKKFKRSLHYFEQLYNRNGSFFYFMEKANIMNRLLLATPIVCKVAFGLANEFI